ncbi:MAG: hypothetical protein FJ077_11630 [Cyanobacteria bacterium K_DeepCast_35m_m2_023]|nr:hypothetical protein [Cyanobacteria bacterium K_DeepCast_35m_m2_023]
MGADQTPFEAGSLQWQDDGELCSSDVYALVRRLKQVETAEHGNELWRLGHKLPQHRLSASADRPRPQQSG